MESEDIYGQYAREWRVSDERRYNLNKTLQTLNDERQVRSKLMADFENAMESYAQASITQSNMNKQNEDTIVNLQKDIKKQELKMGEMTSQNNSLQKQLDSLKNAASKTKEGEGAQSTLIQS